MNKFIRLFFFGNIFYGLCTVALSIESNLQHGISLNSYRFYLLIFLATIVYYGRIYYKSSVVSIDERTGWYRSNRPAIRNALLFICFIIVADIAFIAYINRDVFLHLSLYYWTLLAVVPVIGLMYTAQIFPVKKLRHVGWLKPFVIGFVWAGIVTIFPVLFWQIRNPDAPAPDLLLKFLIWVQNFLFIGALAIVFDLKDYKSDKRHRLNTYPAKYGIEKTIRFIILPVTLFSFLMLLFFHLYYANPLSHLLIQSIPYAVLLILMNGFRKERNLLFYLAAIDGLMLLKAVCGIVSISIF